MRGCNRQPRKTSKRPDRVADEFADGGVGEDELLDVQDAEFLLDEGGAAPDELGSVGSHGVDAEDAAAQRFGDHLDRGGAGTF